MANTVVVKMKCSAVQPATVGGPEVVQLERMHSNSTTEDNTRTANLQAGGSGAGLELRIARGAAAAGQFQRGMTYVVGFTEAGLA